MRRCVLCLAALIVGFAATAQAEPRLIALVSIPSGTSDLSQKTAAPLENGNAGNMFGGIGSGLSYLGAGRFVALPDRGPNAKTYNAAVDHTTSYVPRFQTIDMVLTPSAPGVPLPFTVTPKLVATTLLSSRTPLIYGSGAPAGLGNGAPAINTAGTWYFSGRSDNFDPAKPSSDPANGRLDPEGVRVGSDGALYISDEYGPVLYRFNSLSGERMWDYDLPANLAVAQPAAVGLDEDAANRFGRTGNKGMEGLAVTPDGATLVGIMQAPLRQDARPDGVDAGVVRIVTIDIVSGKTHEYAYALDNIAKSGKIKYGGVNEILAINNHEFLVDERDGKGLGDPDNLEAKFKHVYRIDLTDAIPIDDLAGEAALLPKVVAKTLVLDLVDLAGRAGLAPTQIPAKIEGMTFGPDIALDGQTVHTLWISGDNDFTDDPNMIFVVALADADLPGYVAAKPSYEVAPPHINCATCK